MNKVALFIPDYLTKNEKTEVFSKIDEIGHNNEIHFSFYRTIKEEFLTYLLQHRNLFYENFTIHFLNSLDYEVGEIIETLLYLKKFGLNIEEHYLPVNLNNEASDISYEQYVRRIVFQCDETLSFYKRDENQVKKILKPIDVSKSLNKKSFLMKFTDSKRLQEI